LPNTEELHDAFYHFIEITDLIFMISVIDHDRISAKMLREAKTAGSWPDIISGRAGDCLQVISPGSTNSGEVYARRG
jgi:hypothetical protein